MSGDLRRKKKKSRWGKDLDAEVGVPGSSNTQVAPEVSETPAEGSTAINEHLSEPLRHANLGSETGSAIVRSKEAHDASSNWQSERTAQQCLTDAGAQQDTGWLNSAAEEREDGSFQPKQTFSLSFARPAAKAKIPPAVPASTQAASPQPTAEPPVGGANAPAQAANPQTTAEPPLGLGIATAPGVVPQHTAESLSGAAMGVGQEADQDKKPSAPDSAIAAPLDNAIAAMSLESTPPGGEAVKEGGMAAEGLPLELKSETALSEDVPSLDQPGPPKVEGFSSGRPEAHPALERQPSSMSEDLPPGESPERETDITMEAPGTSEAPRAQATAAEQDASTSAVPAITPLAEKAPLEPSFSRSLSGNPSKEPCSLVINNIRPTANEQSLRLLFESAGQVLGCKLVKDEVTGAHKGFGFVMMASISEAEAAARKFNNFEWGDLRLQVSVKLPVKDRPSQSPAAAPLSTPAGSMPATDPASGQALPPPPGTFGGFPGPPPMQNPSLETPSGSSGPLPGAPSSLPIASAYGAYPPYDPYAAYYGYGYGYDPYAAYGTQPYGVPNGMPLPVAEEERPPGLEDDELPPGQDTDQAEAVPVYEDYQDPGVPSGVAPEAAPEVQEQAEEAQAPPPPPVAPKKEPTVIHVPLKIPEGARKKQEERKKAREEKAKQLAEDEMAEGNDENGGIENDADKTGYITKPAPAIVGTKGSFQEVLARRQAELAALKSKNAVKGPANTQTGAGRPFKRGRSFSRSPPPFQRRSRSHSRPVRSPYRGPVRRPFVRASRSQSRSPIPSYSRSYSRSRSPGSQRGASYSRSPSRYSYSGSDGMDRGSASPGPDRRKDRLKVKDKKDKKRKQKKEKKRKSKSREPVFEQPLPSQAPLMPFRESFLLPPKPMDNKPAPGWVEVDPNERKREIRLPSPPGKEEPKVPSEPAVFRQPVRKRPRTRWHADDDRDRSSDRAKDRDQDGASHEATNGRSATESHRREKNSREQTDDTPKTVAKRKASPQVSEEGEIALEDGEIEGEVLEVAESEPPPRDFERRPQKSMGYEDFRNDDRYRSDDRYRVDERYRDWDQTRYSGGRGRGRGGRGGWGYGQDNRYPEPQPW